MNLTWQQKIREAQAAAVKAEEMCGHMQGVIDRLVERVDKLEAEHNRRKGGRPPKSDPAPAGAAASA